MSSTRSIRATFHATDVHERNSTIRTHLRASITGVCALWLCLCAQPARALDLVWDAPQGCPSRENVLNRIEVRAPAHAAAWEAHAHVTRTASTYTLALSLHGPNAETARREVTAASCEAIAEAAAVLIALALEPESTEQETLEPPAAAISSEAKNPAARAQEASAPPQTSQPPATSETAPDTIPESSSHQLQLKFELALAASLGTGMLPGGSRFAVRPELALRLGRVRAALGGAFWFSADSQAATYPRAQLSDHAWIGDVALGFDLIDTRIAFEPHLALEFGLHTLRTSGISTPAEARVSWAALGVGVRFAYRAWAGLGPVVELFGFAPLAPARFLVHTPAGTVALFEPAPVALRITAGLNYVFE